MQLTKPIAGDGGIHVMLRVVMHLPVEKTEKRIQRDGAAAQPKVWDVILQACVLAVVAEIVQPSSVERRQRNDDRQQPPMHQD
jgi:hypothetical protein